VGRQLSADMVKAGRYQETDIDVNRDHPWKLKNRYSNCFKYEDGAKEDLAFFQLHCECFRTSPLRLAT
jgi:hypothetical protein